MDVRNTGGLIVPEAPGDHLAQGGASPHSVRPARLNSSTFGDDEELGRELPPHWTLRRFQEAAKGALSEYFTCLVIDETTRRIRDILTDCPSEADELGVLAIRKSLDCDESAWQSVVALLHRLHQSGIIDNSAIIRSFEKLFVTWEDIAIDVPAAPEALLSILHGCILAEVVDRAFLSKLPENLLKAGQKKAKPGFAEMLEVVSVDLVEFKQQASRCLEEYFVTLQADEVRSCLRELRMRPYHHELVKRAITRSFSESNYESGKDAVVLLLTQLTAAELLSKDDLQWGLTRLLGQLDDLELDCPRCSEFSTDLIACMVAEELVSVPFLRRCCSLRIGGVTGLRVLDGAMRRTPEFSKKHFGTSQFKTEVQTMILEYFNSGDESEIGRCVRELQPLAPGQSAELIRKLMKFAIERSGHECEMALKLLIWLCRHEELDEGAMARGIDDLYDKMPDLLLDVPDAEDMARAFVVEAKKAKILHGEWPEPAEQ
jgi:hypothetical protein